MAEKWISKAIGRPGALHRALGIPEDEKISVERLKSIQARLSKKAKDEGKLNRAELRMLRMVNLSLNLRKLPRHKGPRE